MSSEENLSELVIVIDVITVANSLSSFIKTKIFFSIGLLHFFVLFAICLVHVNSLVILSISFIYLKSFKTSCNSFSKLLVGGLEWLFFNQGEILLISGLLWVIMNRIKGETVRWFISRIVRVCSIVKAFQNFKKIICFFRVRVVFRFILSFRLRSLFLLK